MSASSSPTPTNKVVVVGDKAKKALDKQRREEERQEKLRQKEAERVRKEEEKRRREEDRQRKEAEKEAERLRKEEEKRKKDEEREQERLRKEEERLRKEDEKRKKDEERQRQLEEKKRKDEEKEQERLKREEEKRKREDEKEHERLKKKLKLDEQEQKARKQAEFMQSFLKKSTPVLSVSTSSLDVSMESPEAPKFGAMSFQLKSGMALAPLHRRPSLSLQSVRKELFSIPVADVIEVSTFEPYLLEIKKREPRKSKRTELLKNTESDVEIIDPKRIIENPTEAGLIKWRWKLLQFHKNERPPYWGTWKRQPIRVTGRRPFSKEEEIDYDFDSDDEWEGEPEDGEDLEDKDDDDKEEDEKCSGVNSGEDDEEDDFLVPHGYLSDDEGGGAEYRDKDTLKTLEEEFYLNLKKDNVNGFPVIDTDNLDQYTMIFYPGDEESDMEMADEGDMDGGVDMEGRNKNDEVRKWFKLILFNGVDGMSKFPSCVGLSLEEFSRLITELRVEDGSTKNEPNKDSVPPDVETSNKIPHNLTHLFGRYPMDDPFSVTTCNYCERIVSSTFMERHVEECSKIPQVIKDELHLLSHGKKARTGSIRRVSSTGDHKFSGSTVSRLVKQSSPSPELSQPAKSSRSANVSSRTCSSAPSSPTSNTQPLDKAPVLVPLNYAFPTIKLEKADSPKPLTSPSPVALSEASKAKKAPQPPALKIKPSVVLKIKGNTSTTSTAGRLSPIPSPSTAELNEGGNSNSPIQIQIPELPSSRIISDPLLMAQPKVELKPLTPSTEPTLPKKKVRTEARKLIPLRERRFNPDEHCGVIGSDGVQCKRSLTCKTHSMASRRAVPGRSHPFDNLISTQKQARHKAKLAKQGLSPARSPTQVQATVVVSTDGDPAATVTKASLASTASVPAVISPSSSLSVQIRPTVPRIPVTNSNVTLQSLLNSGVQSAENVVTVPLLQNMNANSVEVTTIAPVPPAVKSPLKKKIQRVHEPGHPCGLKLQVVVKEQDGFECVTHIIPPVEEVRNVTNLIPPGNPVLIDSTSPLKNTKNVLLLNDVNSKFNYESFPMIAVPVGRRNKEKWRRPSINLYHPRHESESASKKFRRDDSMERLLLGNGDWTHQHSSLETMTITIAQNEDIVEAESEKDKSLLVTSLVEPLPPQKVSFQIHPKKKCRPHHIRNGSYLDTKSGSVTKHVGPLVEVTHALNGLSTDPTPMTFDPVVIPNDQPPIHTEQPNHRSPESCEENSSSWIVDPIPTGGVDAPVADSELSKLLAAQFEDY